MEENIVLITEQPIIGCLNKNVYSSLLFLFPAMYAYYLLPPYSNIMIGSIICLITSVINHYYKSKHTIIRKIDIVLVNSIAGYFILHCLVKLSITFYSIMMYLLSVITMGVYIYIKNKDFTNEYHYLVHILANAGIMFYIKALKNESLLPREVEVPQQVEIRGQVEVPEKEEPIKV